MSWAETKRRVGGVVSYCPCQCPSIGLQNRAQVYRCRTPVIKGKPPSLFNQSHICLPIFNHGFSKGHRTNAKHKRKKDSWECHDLFWRSQETKRDNLHLPNCGMIRCMKISVPLPLGIEIKQLHKLTLSGTQCTFRYRIFSYCLSKFVTINKVMIACGV